MQSVNEEARDDGVDLCRLHKDGVNSLLYRIDHFYWIPLGLLSYLRAFELIFGEFMFKEFFCYSSSENRDGLAAVRMLKIKIMRVNRSKWYFVRSVLLDGMNLKRPNFFRETLKRKSYRHYILFGNF